MIRKFSPYHYMVPALIGLASIFPAGLPTAAQATPSTGALWAYQLVNDARSAGRNLRIPPALAARESLVLLQEARRIDPHSTRVLRLLAEAAAVLHRTSLERSTLLELIRLEPHNLVAQVRFIDALAARYQTVARRIHVYLGILNNGKINPQIRSAAALRIGQLRLAQEHHRQAAAMFIKAVHLNTANLAAWRELSLLLARRRAPRRERLYTLIRQLRCNPFDPRVMASIARILASANDYSAAARWANAAVQQFQRVAAPLDPRLTADLAAWWAIADRQAELRPYLRELLALKHPPTKVLMIALAQASKGGLARGSSAAAILARLHRRLAAASKARPNDPILQSDDLWLDLLYQPELAHDIAARVAALRKPLAGDNPTYLRLRGWQLLRQGYLPAARQRFQAAGNDPYAQLGLARIDAQEHNKSAAAAILRRLWLSHLRSLPALAVARAARSWKVKLPVGKKDKAIIAMAAGYPSRELDAIYHPSDAVLVYVHWPARFCSLGEPIDIDVRYFNSTPWSLAVGPNTALTTNVGLAATLEGITHTSLGAYAVDSNAQVLRLDSQHSLRVRYRVDQGTLADIIWDSPTSLLGGQLRLITNPSAIGARLFPGLGGQEINAGYFNLSGFCSGSRDSLLQVAKKLPSMSAAKRMLAAGVLVCSLPAITARQQALASGATTSSAKPTLSSVRRKLTATLLQLLGDSQESYTQAWIVRRAPYKGLSRRLESAIHQLVASPVALVRIMSYRRLLNMAMLSGDPTELAAVARRLAALAHSDKNTLAARWAADLAVQAAIPPPKRTTTRPAPAPD